MSSKELFYEDIHTTVANVSVPYLFIECTYKIFKEHVKDFLCQKRNESCCFGEHTFKEK